MFLLRMAAHDDPSLMIFSDVNSEFARRFVKVRARLLESLYNDVRQMRAQFWFRFGSQKSRIEAVFGGAAYSNRKEIISQNQQLADAMAHYGKSNTLPTNLGVMSSNLFGRADAKTKNPDQWPDRSDRC
jgi:hypothetical protein